VLTKGGKVKVDLADDKLVFDYGEASADLTANSA